MGLISAKELAARLELTEATITRKARAGTLPGIKPKGFKKWYFDESATKFFTQKLFADINKHK